MSADRFEERLWKAMDASGFESYRSLARASGVDEASISAWVSDRCRPTTRSLAKILRAMPCVDARWLVIGTGQRPKG